MIETLPFQARARTIDHLGREQIADCPTAISELWKNAYDAYASKVELHLHGGDVPVACVLDDGHGMNRDEFVDKWLVIGTESKTTAPATPVEDRNGFSRRIRQGQKGIGRLSCANLAPLLLLVSKRKNNKFVGALLDWRLFENPYLILSDIRIPIVEFERATDILDIAPDLFDQLLTNIWGERSNKKDGATTKDEKLTHKKRIEEAWKSYDTFVANQRKERKGLSAKEKNAPLPSEEIEKTIITSLFNESHFAQWPVWSDEKESGTILLMSDIHFDLATQLNEKILDAVERDSKQKFFETLSSFVDPFLSQNRRTKKLAENMIQYGVYNWIEGQCEPVLGSEQNTAISAVQDMEHVVDGRLDDRGVFKGRIKSFGFWHEEVELSPPGDLTIPTASNTKLGPVEVYISTMEYMPQNTTHTKAEFAHFRELAGLYSGMMVHRDGLRVMPYGRTDADFFDIEQRRSMNAGREFWNHRQMFGRILISRESNPNLGDKAGREGILDNLAAKTFKALIVNLLRTTARNYFGTSSEMRDKILPELKSSYAERKLAEDQAKLRKKRRREFRSKLTKSAPLMASFSNSTEATVDSFSYKTEKSIDDAQSQLDILKKELREFVLGEPPQNLSEEYKESLNEYIADKATAKSTLDQAQDDLNRALEIISKSSPTEHFQKKIRSHKAILVHSSTSYKKRIHALQTDEFSRVGELISERQKLLEDEALPIGVKLEEGSLELQEGLSLLEKLRERIEDENEDMFEPYIGVLESLKESIDLEAIATFGMDQVSELRTEVDRLNSLAQMGIAIEIIGHELQSYDDLIGIGLRELSDEVQKSDAFLSIETGYEGLTDQLRFLSPLKLSGVKTQDWVTGDKISDYVLKFFGQSFEKNEIEFVVSDAFREFRVYDQPSRLYPVFINLVNNSRYWVSHHKSDKKLISLDVCDEQVVISDTGPGVNPEDVKSLFTLFFSKKLSGGRGVGLYLCRANLTAGGHRIEYTTEPKLCQHNGANFAIKFRGAEYA